MIFTTDQCIRGGLFHFRPQRANTKWLRTVAHRFDSNWHLHRMDPNLIFKNLTDQHILFPKAFSTFLLLPLLPFPFWQNRNFSKLEFPLHTEKETPVPNILFSSRTQFCKLVFNENREDICSQSCRFWRMSEEERWGSFLPKNHFTARNSSRAEQ